MSLHHGDCLAVMRGFDADSFDAIVTDPPAGIAFMGKDWDKDRGGRLAWVAWMTTVMRECLRVLKPGAHGLVWALPRTSHWTATALEDAGFEVRDVVTHLFGTGFPKSLDVSKAIDKAAGANRRTIGKYELPDVADGRRGKGWECTNTTTPGIFGASGQVDITAPATDAAKQWQGWGTALKPASEHWILVRKPLSEKTVAANVLKHGTGGINVDAGRIAGAIPVVPQPEFRSARGRTMSGLDATARNGEMSRAEGRFPANVLLDEEAARILDEQVGYLGGAGNKSMVGPPPIKAETSMFGIGGNKAPDIIYDRGGSASRFFYVAKASKADRGEGNTHPTVKSTKLMEYLIKLITPPGGCVLDPFMGSGSTGVAARNAGMRFCGIEECAEYLEIARGRIA